MSRFFRLLRNAFTAQLVTFVAGLLASIVIRAIFGQIIPLSESLLALMTIILIVLTMAVMASLRQDINANILQSRLSTRVYHAHRTADGDVPLYDPVMNIIASAKESVRVVSLFRPPSLEITKLCKPPAMPGRLPEFDSSGSIRRAFGRTTRTNHQRFYMNDYESLICAEPNGKYRTMWAGTPVRE